jgi:predicted ATPase
MSVRSLEIKGLRGFAESECLDLAIPNGKFGSGLTVLVGPNNGGKSTIVEAFAAFSREDPKLPDHGPSFAKGMRNSRTGARVHLRATPVDGEAAEIKTVEAGGSETIWHTGRIGAVVLPARRFFNPFFEKFSDYMHSSTYFNMGEHPTLRNSPLDRFYERIFKAYANKEFFNQVLGRIIDPVPEWNIEQADNGKHYLQFQYGNSSHSSDGLGDGVLSIWFIVDALYDSSEKQMIVIDEPEQSLHPSLQKKLFEVLGEYAKERQIVYATHSPYFINWDAVFNGAQIVRVYKHKGDERTALSALKHDTVRRLQPLAIDKNNPHTLGLNACEIFFLEDKVVLVEGQEDVIHYKLIAEELGCAIPGDFFGWGVGGAEKMPVIAQMLFELGFRRVVGILDKGMEPVKQQMEEQFPDFRFFVIPAEDVRSKDPIKPKSAKDGLIKKGRLQEKYRTHVEQILSEVKTVLSN